MGNLGIEQAWKTMFDDFLQEWTQHTGRMQLAFDLMHDYARYVDGSLGEGACHGTDRRSQQNSAINCASTLSVLVRTRRDAPNRRSA